MRSANQDEARPRPRSFWQTYPEKEELNQYWYSASTVEALANEVLMHTAPGARCAFLSTPSVYFAVKAQCQNRDRELFLFDYDAKFASEGDAFVPYDFHRPTEIPKALCGAVDFILIDPPFITEEVWAQYATTARLLAPPSTGAKILLSTIAENELLIGRLLGCSVREFKPSIPHLVYQYALFANYASPALDCANPEVPEPDKA